MITPEKQIYKLVNNKNYKLNSIKNKSILINDEKKKFIYNSMRIKKNNNLEKILNIKNINMSKSISFSDKNFFKHNNFNLIGNNPKKIFQKNISLNDSFHNLENTPNNNFNQFNLSKNNITNFNSTKNLISLKSIDEKMIENKVNNIVNNLLLENNKNTKEQNNSMISFPLIELKLKKEPNNNEMLYSFNLFFLIFKNNIY